MEQQHYLCIIISTRDMHAEGEQFIQAAAAAAILNNVNYSMYLPVKDSSGEFRLARHTEASANAYPVAIKGLNSSHVGGLIFM